MFYKNSQVFQNKPKCITLRKNKCKVVMEAGCYYVLTQPPSERRSSPSLTTYNPFQFTSLLLHLSLPFQEGKVKTQKHFSQTIISAALIMQSNKSSKTEGMDRMSYFPNQGR